MAFGRPEGLDSALRTAFAPRPSTRGAPTGRGTGASAQRARAATPKKSFTSRSALAGLSEAWTELRNLLSA